MAKREGPVGPHIELEEVREEALQFAGIGLYRYRFDGMIVFMDEVAARIFELDHLEGAPLTLRGKNIAELVVYIGPEGEMRREVLQKKHVRGRIWSFRTLRGNEKWVVEDSYLVSDPEMGEDVIQVVTRDITEERRSAGALEESERRFRDTLENLDLYAVQLDVEGKITFCNEYLARVTGWAREELIGRDWLECFVPEANRAGLKASFEEHKASWRDIPTHYENPILTRAGEERLVVWNNTVLLDGAGHAVGLTSIGQDITARHQAEELLRTSEARYRTTLDNLADAVHLVDENLRILLVNEGLRRWLGELRLGQDPVGKKVLEAFPFLPESIGDEYKQVMERGESLITVESSRIDGREVVTQTRKIPVVDSGGKMRVLTVIRDITQQTYAETALRESESKYRTLVEMFPHALAIFQGGKVVFATEAMRSMFGYERLEDLLGREVIGLVAPQERERVRQYAALRDSGGEGAPEHYESLLLRADGTPFDAEIFVRNLQFQGTIAQQVLAMDITKRKKAEQALRESEALYRELFENANDMVYTHDLSARLTSLNGAGERVTGYLREEALEMSVLDVVAPECQEMARQNIARKLAGEDITQYELEICAKDGRRIPVEVSTRIIYRNGKPAGIQGIARDITERRQAEEQRALLEAQIQHAQKLEGLGVLAGGIAHDFNNLLVGVLGNAGLALSKLPAGSPAAQYVERIESTAQRAAELTNQMLAYSGKGTFVVQPVDLSHLAEDMGHLLEATISKKAVLKYAGSRDVPMIRGDVTQLHQVIMNLLTNASDALGDAPGVITLSTSVVDLDRSYLASTYLDDDLGAGRYVCLEVADTGCGMDAETKARIFDPFFSTKFAGRGLGLAAVLGIVRGHKGAIKVYSEPGQGTTFRVLFPAAPESEEAAGASDARAPGAEKEWSGAGTVLVADDEPNVLEVTEEALENAGFRVLRAVDGREAVALFEKHGAEITAVLLDLTMPVMGGKEAFHAILEMRPEVPVILSSGFTEQDVVARFEDTQPAAFIQKPYLPSQLIRVFREVLSA